MTEIKITVNGFEDKWDPRFEEFVTIKTQTITLVHSLISLHKWEAKWKKPYLSKKEKTTEEIIDYIRCMTVEKDIDPRIYYYLDEDDYKKITEYIDDPMSATTFHNYGDKTGASNDIVTAEVIYYLMIQYGIPIEFRKWHLNQLITLIRVCEIKNGGGKKMSEREILTNNKKLNAQRRAMLHSKG